jgi:hypothetical protein
MNLVTIAPPEPALGETQPLIAPPEPTPTAPLATSVALPARDRALLFVAAGSSVLALVLAIALVAALGARPTAAAAPIIVTRAALTEPTPALSAPAPQIVAFWAPEGGVYGAIVLEGDITILEQYRGWARFRTSYMAAALWAPVAALQGAVPAAQIAAAPEIAPTALPTSVSAPAPIIVAASAATQATAPAAPTTDAQGMIVLENTADRYVAVAATPPGATAEPERWGRIGGGGGSWGRRRPTFARKTHPLLPRGRGCLCVSIDDIAP